MKRVLSIILSVVLVFGMAGMLAGCTDKDPNGKVVNKKAYTSEDGKYLYRVGKNTNERGKVINYYAIITDVLKFDDPEATEFTFPEEVDGYVVEQLGYVKLILNSVGYFLSANEFIETIYVPETVKRIPLSSSEDKWFFDEWSAKKTVVIMSEDIDINRAIFWGRDTIVVINATAMQRFIEKYNIQEGYKFGPLKLYDEWIQELEKEQETENE